MPPKPRGSVRGRGRGGRGGSAGSGIPRATDAPPELSGGSATVATEAVETIVPKAEDGEGTAATAFNLSAAPESQLAPSATATASSTSSPQTVADSVARPPVQRLDSLKTPAPSSRSASPAVRRGATTRGKKAAVKPTFTGRRSKEERDARDKLDRERQKERDKEAEKKQKQRERQQLKNARGGQKTRGGYSGPITGPFSLGSSTQDRKSSRSSNPYGGSGSGSGSRAVQIKREYNGEEGGGGGGGSRGHRSSGTSAIKREDGGYVSSDDEENPEFPRKDIDTIEISDDEDTAGPSDYRERTNLPVRISRKEHHDRVVGINTEASAETAAKTSQVEAMGTSPKTEDTEGASRKGKGKGKDLEITGVRKPYKGMWQDVDEPQLVQVKTEPTSDDEDQGPAEEVGIFEASNKAVEKPEPSAPEAEKKIKARGKVEPEPVMQTDEDRQEWARFQSNLRHIRAELGPDAEELNVTGDSIMNDANAPAKAKRSVRDNNVYLFQIPPTMPDLLAPTAKNEPSEELSIPPPPTTQQTQIKIEQGAASTMRNAKMTSGFLGKLRVHQSGRTTLDWGGTSYELNPGHKASYLQEAVGLNVVPEKDRVVEEDGGEAISCGRVKGKFVVVPAWEKMLG